MSYDSKAPDGESKAPGDLPGQSPSGEPRPSGRDAAGRFVRGNVESLKHGQRSERAGSELVPSLAAVLSEREAAIIADLGGAACVSAVKRELITRFIQSSAISDSLALNIVTHGVLTSKGRQRAAVTTYLQVVDRLTRLAAVLGLERRVKPVTLASIISEHEAAP